MPLRPGNLRLLAGSKDRRSTDDSLCMQVLEQILSALDYLDDRGYCHRDIKPENILYYEHSERGTYTFQLADFGLANHRANAVTILWHQILPGSRALPRLRPGHSTNPKDGHLVSFLHNS